MPSPLDTPTLWALLLALLFGASVLGLGWRQSRRLASAERRLSPPARSSCRAVALRQLLPPAEPGQPTLAGVPLPGGLMAWTAPLAAPEAVAALVLEREGPTAYVGPDPEPVVREVALRARAAGVDPRSRLFVAGEAAELEGLLEARVLPAPWVVAEPPLDLEGLLRLHHRFGSPLLLVGSQEVPRDFLALPPGVLTETVGN